MRFGFAMLVFPHVISGCMRFDTLLAHLDQHMIKASSGVTERNTIVLEKANRKIFVKDYFVPMASKLIFIHHRRSLPD